MPQAAKRLVEQRVVRDVFGRVISYGRRELKTVGGNEPRRIIRVGQPAVYDLIQLTCRHRPGTGERADACQKNK